MSINNVKSKFISDDLVNKMFFVAFLFLVGSYFVSICLPIPFLSTIQIKVIINIGYIFMLIIDVVILIKYADELKRVIAETVCNSKFVVIFFILYIVWDLINFFYADNLSYALPKLIVMGKSFFIMANFIVYINKKSIEAIFLFLGVISLLFSLIFIIGFLTGDYTYYLRKISALKDYNVSSTVILLGLIANFYIVTRGRIWSLNKWGLFFLNLTLCGTVIFLSGSRKNLIIMLFFVFFYVGYFLIKGIYQQYRDINKTKVLRCKHMMIIVLIGIISLCSMISIISAIKSYSDNRYNEYAAGNYKWKRYEINDHKEENNDQEDSSLIVAETDIKDRYETISGGNAANVRLMIWRTSINWIREMTGFEKIVGGGNSHSIDVFDDINNPINAECIELYGGGDLEKKNWLYPHNLFLNDMLDGGIVKVIILLCLMGAVFNKIYKCFIYNFGLGMVILSVWGVIFIMLMTSGGLGLLGNKFIWLPLSLTLVYKVGT